MLFFEMLLIFRIRSHQLPQTADLVKTNFERLFEDHFRLKQYFQNGFQTLAQYFNTVFDMQHAYVLRNLKFQTYKRDENISYPPRGRCF